MTDSPPHFLRTSLIHSRVILKDSERYSVQNELVTPDGKGLFDTYSRIDYSELVKVKVKVKVVIKFQLHLAAQMCRWWTVCHILTIISNLQQI